MKELVTSEVEDALNEIKDQQENLFISFRNEVAYRDFIKHLCSKECRYVVKTRETVGKELAILDHFVSPTDKKLYIKII